MIVPNHPKCATSDIINYRKLLEHLYTRAALIDALSESLREYDRLRALRAPDVSITRHPLSISTRNGV
jgi:hypothetical protein